MQEQERKKQKEMERWVKHIRKTFRGDERFMILSTYYRQQNYQPMNAIRGSLSLLLQIPFFIAAYHYLTHVNIEGASFVFLNNLGEADRLLQFGGLTLNLMPVVMTLINVVSGYIYTKGFPLKDKLQLYLLAVLFLVVLYKSPSGLVLYWTMNNLFSLLKNIVMKIVRPLNLQWKSGQSAKAMPRIFWWSAVLLTVLLGLVIPISVVGASQAEFISLNAYRNPLVFVWLTFCVAMGVFLVWGGILYYLTGDNLKPIVEKLACMLGLIGLADYMFFGNHTGIVSPILTYQEGLDVDAKRSLISLLIVAILAVIIMVSWRFHKVWRTILTVLTISLFGMGMWNVIKAEHELKDMNYVRSLAEESTKQQVSPILTLSKTEKNVIVFMLDRAISDYFPYCVAEKPELGEQYAGFVYYPNTISFGQCTLFASAAIFGGYEYLPTEINARSDELLVEKQNEALKVMPVLFDELGYDVTVCDPPLAGYKEIPDLSIYDAYPDIDTHITIGAYLGDDQKFLKRIQDSQERNFFCYSLMKIAPFFLQPYLYDGGVYYESLKNNTQNPQFMESYMVLVNLNGLTDISENSRGGFVMINNEAPHDPRLLQLPDYEPTDDVNNGGYEDSSRFTLDGRQMKVENSYGLEHYHVSMATYLQIGNWLEFLKQNGVYDNTRIIIVADHGRPLGQFEDLQVSDGLDLEGYHPIFLVKDFADEKAEGDNRVLSGKIMVSDEFMTNADVPTLALQGLMEEPTNPFTGNLITNAAKADGNLMLTTADGFDESIDGKVFNTENGVWYTFIGTDIFDKSSWQQSDDIN